MKVSRLYLISSSISFLYCILTICFIDYLSVPWTDEIGTADTAINVVLYGQWKSDVWLYIYQPLHAFFLIPWIFIFGFSHASVCSINVFIAFISSCYIIRITERRKWFLSLGGLLIFISLFWLLVWHTNGRIDMLTMLFTIGVADNLIPDEGRSQMKMLAVMSFLLMMTSIYSIPVLVCGGLVLIYYYWKNRQIRLELTKKAICVTCSMTFAFILTLIFFYFDGHLIKYLHQFIRFNSTINGANTSFVEQIVLAYSYWIPLFLTIIGMIFSSLKKDKLGIIAGIFILFIPLIMIMSGRYKSYYYWLFIVPAIMLFAYSIDYLLNRKYLRIISYSVLFFYPAKCISSYINPSESYYERIEKEEFIRGNTKYFRKGSEVYAFDAMFYYPLVEQRAIINKEIRGMKKEPLPMEKFQNFANTINDNSKREIIVKLFNKIEKASEKEMKNGFIICFEDKQYRQDQCDMIINYLKSLDLKYSIVASKGNMRIIKFTQKVNNHNI